MSWQRARRPEQKQARRETIMAAAKALFDEKGFETVSLGAIARRAGLAKSNLYRYFETKEELFLRLLLDELADWVVAVEYTLGAEVGSGEAEVVAREIAGTVSERPRLAALLASLPGSLERNVSEEVVAGFRRSLLTELARVQEAIHAAMPEVSREEAGRLLVQFRALVAGLWPMGRPSPALDRALRSPDLSGTRVDFRRELEESLRALLRGYAAAD